MISIEDITAAIRAFADARHWQQFHTVRNLVLALTGEVGELTAEVQWIADDNIEQLLRQSDKMAAIESELADVAIYALRLADVLEVDLADAIARKIRLNEQRYPVEQAWGNSLKYTELHDGDPGRS